MIAGGLVVGLFQLHLAAQDGADELVLHIGERLGGQLAEEGGHAVVEREAAGVLQRGAELRIAAPARHRLVAKARPVERIDQGGSRLLHLSSPGWRRPEGGRRQTIGSPRWLLLL